MTELRIGDQLIHFDRNATISAYSEIQRGEADRCRAQVAATSPCCDTKLTLRPSAFCWILSESIQTKEGEAVHCGPVEGDLHFYEGWFYFVGEVAEKGERLVEIENVEAADGLKNMQMTRGFRLSREFEYFSLGCFPGLQQGSGRQ